VGSLLPFRLDVSFMCLIATVQPISTILCYWLIFRILLEPEQTIAYQSFRYPSTNDAFELFTFVPSFESCAFLLFLILHFRFVHSLLIGVLTFGMNFVVEFTFNLIITNFEYVKFIAISKNDYFIQGLLLLSINTGLLVLVNKFRIGFTFASSQYVYSKANSIPPKLVLNLLIGALLIAASGLFIVFFDRFFLLIFIIVVFIIISALHWLYVKEANH
jgi:hypothetical protein